jgi:predicted MPP superfamily phosphohydrolase
MISLWLFYDEKKPMLREQTKPFTVTYHSLTQNREESDLRILEERWLHKLFLITHVTAQWPPWKLGLALLAITAVVWYAWLPLGPVAFTAAAIYLGFSLGDWLLLAWLPRSSRSFGPVGPQLVVMTAPRLGVAVLLGLAAWLFGWGEASPLLLWGLTLLQLFGTTIYLWGMLYEPFALGITQRPVQSDFLPSGAPPIRLLHLSDFHIERLTAREAHLLALIEQARPDVIVITGDFLNLSYVNEPIARAEVQRILARLAAPYGVYATLGSPPVDPRDTTPSLFDGLDIRLLRDEVAVLNLPDGRTLSLLGMDCDHDLEGDARVFRQLIRLAPPDSMRVLLFHSPELMPVVKDCPVELYLCGHTHGGQARLPLYGAILTSSALGKQYEMGPYVEQGTTLYVSRGIGLEGLSAPRLRLLCPPEIILFTLSGK